MTAQAGRPAIEAESGAHSTGSLVDGMTIGDHFIIRGKLGGGGMGEVYLAENLNVVGKKYAIKVLRREFSDNPRFVTMLQDEASKQARLDHDNVVGMYDFFRWAGHYCLLQTFVKGKTLAQMIAEQPAGLDREVALTLMMGILSGLDYAHEAGILHCDMKPANVIVDPEGRPRVTDFGISRDIGATSRSSGLAGAGTAEYMSPEQIRPPYDIDHRSDVFSAGVMLFEMLCGRLPFDTSLSTNGVGLPQLTTDAPDVRRFRADTPEPIARIVATALQRDPAQRFQGCADFKRAIVDYRKRERWRRTWLPAIVVTSVFAAAGAIGLYQWRQHVDEQVKLQEELNHQESIALAARKEKTVGDVLHNAAAALNLLCHESAEYRIKKSGVDAAIKSGLDDMARLFEAKLKGMEEGIAKQAGAYAGAMRQLRKEDAALVAKGIARQSEADTLVQGFTDTIKADDATLRAGGEIPPLDQMLSRCPPPKTFPAR